MNLLKSNSNNFYYSKGTGQPMVFLHGFPDCPKNYENQINYFSELGYEVFCPFMPGYHPEDKELPSYDPTTISLEIIKFIEKNRMAFMNRKPRPKGLSQSTSNWR